MTNPTVDPCELLVDSIHQCLRAIRDDEDITLLIEPEPGMFIETVEQGLRLIEEVNSPKFQLHLDICHMYCSEKDYVSALAQAAPYARYLHVSDAQEGYNLKIVKMAENLTLDLDFASYLIYFPEFADYLLVDRNHPVFFYDEKPGREQEECIESILNPVNIAQMPFYVDYNGLFAGSSPFDDGIFTYLISVPGLNFDVLERAGPILIYLRSTKDPDGKLLVDKMVANTLTGIVHFHEIPGEGTLDFAAKVMVKNNIPSVIINMTSVMAVLALVDQVPYCAAKGGANQLTKSMALALSRYGICVNAIGPGPVLTDLMKRVVSNKEKEAVLLDRMPLRRIAECREIATVAVFPAYDDFSFITGQCIYPDGGRMIQAFPRDQEK